MTTIYEQLTAAGCEVDHHESDLYVRATPEARAILRAANSGAEARAFTCQRSGATWVDIPFAYDPFWHRLSRR